MKIVSAFYVYRLYITFKAHFSQETTDISKYGFRPFKISYDTFIETRGIEYYERIAKRMKKEKDVVGLFISAFIEDPNTWIGTIADDMPRYIDLKEIRDSRLDNIKYLFQKNMLYLLDSGMKFDGSMGQFCLYRFLESNIELETFIILRKIFNFTLDNTPNYDYLYKGKYEKYEMLLNVDTEKYKKLIEEIIMSNRD